MLKSLFISMVLFLGMSGSSVAQYNNASTLQLEDIMLGKDFIGYWPENHSFLPNGDVVFHWKQDADRYMTWYINTPSTNSVRKLTLKEEYSLPLSGYEYSKLGKFAVYTKFGGVYKWADGTAAPQLIFESSDKVNQVVIATDPSILYLEMKSNFYQLNTKNGRLTQMTNFINATESEEPKKELNYIESQELQMFEELNIVKARADYGTDKKEKSKLFFIPEVHTGTGDIYDLNISPNGKFATFELYNKAETSLTEVQHFVTVDGQASPAKARPKVGRKDADIQFFMYDLENDNLNQLDVDKLSEINRVHDFLKEYGVEEYKNKGVTFHGAYFNTQSSRAVLEVKSLDNKHRWILELNLSKGDFTEIDHQYDRAWIGGPGISGWNESAGNLGWFKDGERVFYQSEKTGYSHLYVYDFTTKKATQVTNGDFEIHTADLNIKNDYFYVTSNKISPADRGFYKVSLKGKFTSVLEKAGSYDAKLSPDEKVISYLYSDANSPWELFSAALEKPNDSKQVTKSVRAGFQKYNFRIPEVVKVQSVDGKEISARLYRGTEASKGPAVIFVHGAGYLQNAHNWWSLYYREYMFHNFLVDNGYTVLDMDYRGSEGYGRDWRTEIYRSMGGKDLFDQISGKEYLVDELGVDAKRIGMYGGSYGGFITLMALMKEPGHFACGAALRSVTDWTHYNHEYTSNILNTPEEDSLAYQRSSPIYYADNLDAPLLMLHGMVDDNVQYQDVVRLSQKFIELGKDNWEMANYPVEAHSFRRASSWLDEYKRIYKLFEEELK